jgi:hypothetical protein
MTFVDSRPVVRLDEPRSTWLVRRLGPAWPLKALLLGFPLWWALGVAQFAFLSAAVAMAVQMYRRGSVRVPAAFGVWLLFLMWMAAGVFVLWAHAPGTLDGGGPIRIIPFLFRVMWYLAITVAMLYPLSMSSRILPAMDVARWLAALFVFSVLAGVAGLVLPHFQFTSLTELIVPGAKARGTFIHTMLHPALTTSSDFLGYEQPRPKAPFAYPNAWGNNVGLLLPFFVVAWVHSKRRWQRVSVPLVLALFLLPVAYSLNRGLWLGILLVAVYAAVALARAGRVAALWTLMVVAIVATVILVASPVWSTIMLRIETPHSNARRGTVAQVVVDTTWQGSPLLGFGTTRKVTGNFASIAGTGSTDCHQCSAPPLGTQGFLWRLILTTGFVGTALFAVFMVVQWLKHFRRRDIFSVLGCMSLAMSALFFIVYDSLDSPMFILMLAVGLMNRERLQDEALESDLVKVDIADGPRLLGRAR